MFLYRQSGTKRLGEPKPRKPGDGAVANTLDILNPSLTGSFCLATDVDQRAEIAEYATAPQRDPFTSPEHSPSSNGTGDISLFSRLRRRSQVMSTTSPRSWRRLLDRSKLSSAASAAHGKPDTSERELKPRISVCEHTRVRECTRKHSSQSTCSYI